MISATSIINIFNCMRNCPCCYFEWEAESPCCCGGTKRWVPAFPGAPLCLECGHVTLTQLSRHLPRVCKAGIVVTPPCGRMVAWHSAQALPWAAGERWPPASESGNGPGVASFYGVTSTLVVAAAWSSVSLPGPKTAAFSLPSGSLGLNNLKNSFFLLKVTRVGQATGAPDSGSVCIWQSGSWAYTSPLILLSLCNDLILEGGIPH